jgi:hypothetical protein
MQLVTPSAPPATSTCGQYELVAETVTAYEYLLDCAGFAVDPAPAFALSVGGRMRVAGEPLAEPGVTLTTDGAAVRLDGDTVTGVAPGKARVLVRGLPCQRTEPRATAPCTLLSVTVS